ncbi:MAG: APC family permease [Candidatus Dormibacteraeota bacterium]|nr:APC family permease [Candidatus Dormibacteraeota bacterium]
MTEIAKPGVVGGAETVVPLAAQQLKRDSLSMPEVLAQSVANMAPSAAMALLPLLVFLTAGNGTWVSFVIAIVLMACVGYCAAQFARRMTSSGSFYVWVTRALGPAAGHTAGWALQLGYIATGIATMYGFAIFGVDFLNRVSGGAIPATGAWLFVILFLIDFFLPVAIAVMDMGLSTRTSLVLESISICIILVLCVAIWVHKGGIVDPAQFTLKGVGTGGLFVGVVLAVFAFVGFESAGSLGMEAKDPYRSVGRAILLSCIIVGLFYVVVSYSQVFGFEGTKGGFAKSGAPLPDLAVVVGLNPLAWILDLGIVCSMFACTLACINAAARISYTMAHDGMGHQALKQTHTRHRTPHRAIWTVAVPMIVITIVPVLFHQDPILLTGYAGTVATFGFMLAYALVAIGAPLFLARLGQRWVPVAVVGTVGAVAMAFVFWSSWLPQTIPGGLFPALTGVAIWLPYIFIAWIAVGLAWYFIARSRDPQVTSRIGSQFESAGQLD